MNDNRFLDVIAEIVELLASSGERNWAATISGLSDRYRNAGAERDRRNALRDIRRLYGGMGSFNDLVLSDGAGHMLIDENTRLDALKKALFAVVSDELATTSSIDERDR